jgi:exonuclease III
MNIQGIAPKTKPSKVTYISDLLNSSNQLFIGLSETWLRDQLDAELHINNYKLFRTDRKRIRTSRFGRDSGGTAIYLRSDLAPAFEQVISYSNGNVEACGIFSKLENFIIIVLYRQPNDHKGGNQSTGQQFKQLMNCIQNIINNICPTPDIILGGDFNLPHANWDSFTHKPGAGLDEQGMISTMRDMCNDNALLQVIKSPTHYQGNTLDLVFTNNTELIHSYQCNETLRSISHHYIVELATGYKTTYQESQYEPRNLMSPLDQLNFFSPSIDWEKVNQEISEIDWDSLLQPLDNNDMLNTINNAIITIASNNMPKRRPPRSPKCSIIPRERIRIRIRMFIPRLTKSYYKKYYNNILMMYELS